LQKIKDYNFREGIKKVVIESEERIGIYEAWNTAIENSTYDYVMNYNTDDKLYKSALMILAANIKTFPEADVIYSNSFICDDSQHENLVNFYRWADAGHLPNLIQGCCCGPFPLLKKKSVVDAGMFNPEFTICGDYEMWCRMNVKGCTFMQIDEPLGVYYHNPTGMSTNNAHRQEHIHQDNVIRDTYRSYIR
jgi:cellulose synthase/poly-beta-1,6-N-acetylglucosamine synthase-like glycosyltransferase